MKLIKSDNPDFVFSGKGRALVNVNRSDYEIRKLSKKATMAKDAEITALRDKVNDLSVQLEKIISLIHKQPEV